MTAPRHAQGPPDHCAACRKIFAVCRDGSAVPPTVAMLGAACGLSERMTRLHLAHLVAHGRLAADRRTLVEGATVGPTGEIPHDELTPLDWVASVSLSCRSCRKLLTALATLSRGSWRGQISMAGLGALVSLSEHTARMHTRTGHTAKGRIGHSLVGDGLVAFVADGEIVGQGPTGRTQYVRRPDRFVLWPTEDRAPAGVRQGETWGQDQALQMLDEIQWFDPTHDQAEWVMRLVATRIKEGWTEVEIIRALDVTPRTELPLRRPYMFARRRLEGQPAPRPVPEVKASVGRAARPRCAGCAVPFGPGQVSPDGLCRECREDGEGVLPLGPLVRAEPARCFHCSHQVGAAQWLCDGCGADQRIPA